jgi:hypothetical protein
MSAMSSSEKPEVCWPNRLGSTTVCVAVRRGGLAKERGGKTKQQAAQRSAAQGWIHVALQAGPTYVG